MSKTIPIYSANMPGGGIPKKIGIDECTPIYSSYTGSMIAHGSIIQNTICDAPIGHPHHDKSYTIIIYNPINGSYMASYDES
jgi:hypothetical protein